MDFKTLRALAKALKPIMKEHGATLRAFVAVGKDLLPHLQSNPELANLAAKVPPNAAEILDLAGDVLDLA